MITCMFVARSSASVKKINEEKKMNVCKMIQYHERKHELNELFYNYMLS